MGNCSFKKKKNCVFCEIIQEIGDEEAFDKDKILAHDDSYVVLSDLHPAAAHHYLVIPKIHVKNAKELKGQEHIEMVQGMYEYGKAYLQKSVKNEIVEDCLYGFHYPPFISIDHLHLHVIYPASSMNFTNANLFRKDTWHFVSPEKLIDLLAK